MGEVYAARRKSLDDVAKLFFGVQDGRVATLPYTFDDVVSALNADPKATSELAQAISSWPMSSPGYYRDLKNTLTKFVESGFLTTDYALLEPVGVPGDLVVNESMAVILEVDPLGGRVGGEEDPQPALQKGREVLLAFVESLDLQRIQQAAVLRHALLALGDAVRRHRGHIH